LRISIPSQQQQQYNNNIISMASNTENSNLTNDAKEHAVKTTPKDALVMAAILREMGVSEYEPRVINQMVEFAYRYVTDTIEDARVYSTHANRKNISLDDVKLAVSQRLDQSHTSAPPREFLLDVARKKNAQPLPVPPERVGLRLPPERYQLTASNYKLKSINKKATQSTTIRKPTAAAGGQKVAPSAPKSLSLTGVTSSASPRPAGVTSTQQQQLLRAGSPRPHSPISFNQSAGQFPPTRFPPSTSTSMAIAMAMQPSGVPIKNEFPSILKRKHEIDEDDYDA